MTRKQSDLGKPYSTDPISGDLGEPLVDAPAAPVAEPTYPALTGSGAQASAQDPVQKLSDPANPPSVDSDAEAFRRSQERIDADRGAPFVPEPRRDFEPNTADVDAARVEAIAAEATQERVGPLDSAANLLAENARLRADIAQLRQGRILSTSELAALVATLDRVVIAFGRPAPESPRPGEVSADVESAGRLGAQPSELAEAARRAGLPQTEIERLERLRPTGPAGRVDPVTDNDRAAAVKACANFLAILRR